MSIAASIASAVLKSVVGDKLGNGLTKDLIGISIDGITEKGINEITDFINREKSKIDSILSKENMESMGISEDHIDYVVAEIKDLFSKISITDEVFRKCKYNSSNLKDFIWNEYIAHKSGYIEYENEIKSCLFDVAEALTKLARESENFEKDVLIHISNSVDDANAGLQNIYDYMKDNLGKLDANSQIVLNILSTILEQIQKMNMQDNEIKRTTDEEKKFKNNKKEDYIKNWNSRLFLHIDNDDNPLTLADTFIMPDYKMWKSTKRIGFFENDTLDKIIEKFVNYDTTSTMLLTGVPGIGKSSIISWISNRYIDDDRFIILRFRDWKKENLNNGLIAAVCDTLNCLDKDLDNKVLVLDGFDEMKTLDIRNELLDLLFVDILDFNNLKCIISSRINYIREKQFDNVLEIKTFNTDKIIEFCRKVDGKIYVEREILRMNNKEVLGVPVILYMAIMCDIDITKATSKPELYSLIFSEQGGIFERFSHEGIAYSKGQHILRDSANIKIYLKFLREVAFTMFGKDNLILQKSEFKVPELVFQKRAVNILDFPLKQLFDRTNTSIEFIHKSIYEYFVSEYILIILENTLVRSKVGAVRLAGVLGDVLKSNYLSKEILEFLKFKINNGKLKLENNVINETFQLMLQDGMTYYTYKNYKNVIKCERCIFVNMLELIHLWESGYIKINDSEVYYFSYINYERSYYNLNLEGMDLSNLNLSGINFQRVNLKNANLKKAKLIDANLESADLSNADLSGADLSGANLKGTSLKGANFEKANLSQIDLQEHDLRNLNFNKAIFRGTNLKKANLEGAIMTGAFLKESNIRSIKINDSVWLKDDIKSIYRKLEKLYFFDIIVINQDKKERIIKGELFPE